MLNVGVPASVSRATPVPPDEALPVSVLPLMFRHRVWLSDGVPPSTTIAPKSLFGDALSSEKWLFVTVRLSVPVPCAATALRPSLSTWNTLLPETVVVSVPAPPAVTPMPLPWIDPECTTELVPIVLFWILPCINVVAFEVVPRLTAIAVLRPPVWFSVLPVMLKLAVCPRPWCAMPMPVAFWSQVELVTVKLPLELSLPRYSTPTVRLRKNVLLSADRVTFEVFWRLMSSPTLPEAVVAVSLNWLLVTFSVIVALPVWDTPKMFSSELWKSEFAADDVPVPLSMRTSHTWVPAVPLAEPLFVASVCWKATPATPVACTPLLPVCPWIRSLSRVRAEPLVAVMPSPPVLMPLPPLFSIVMLRSVTFVAVDSSTPALVAFWMVPPEPSVSVPPPFLAVVRPLVVFAGSEAPPPSTSKAPVVVVSVGSRSFRLPTLEPERAMPAVALPRVMPQTVLPEPSVTSLPVAVIETLFGLPPPVEGSVALLVPGVRPVIAERLDVASWPISFWPLSRT